MFAVYFAGVMVRLMLVLAPVMCILGGIAVSSSLSTYMKYLDKDKTSQHVSNGKPSTGTHTVHTKNCTHCTHCTQGASRAGTSRT